MTIPHSEISSVSNHPIVKRDYADAAARTGDTTLQAKDIKTVAYQIDNDTYWILKDTTPTWTPLAGAALDPTLKDAYDASPTGARVVLMDDGKVQWVGSTTSDFEIGLDSCTGGDLYGFRVVNGTDHVKVLKTDTNEIKVEAEAGEIVLGASGDIVLDTAGSLGVGTTDLDGTPDTGRLVVKATTNDGSTNCLVLRDSDEANIATWDSNGMVEMSGAAGSDIGLLDITVSSDNSFTWTSSQIAPSLTTGHNVVSFIGKAKNSKNSGYFGFYYDSNNSDNNCISIGLYAVDNVLNVSGAGNVGVGTLTPSQKLEVNGDASIIGDLRLPSSDIITDTTTGTKIATATNQKLGFFGATPVVQPTEITDELTTITHTAPGTPDYAVQDLTDSSPFGFVTKDEGNTVLSVIANLQTRVNELETRLANLGLLADAD
jgi:hypothetical protein